MPENHTPTVDESSLKFSNELLELHVAPKLGRLLAPIVPAVEIPKGHFGSWFLNNTFTAQIKRDDLRVLMSIYINRTEFACLAYDAARIGLQDYVARLGKTNAHISVYRAALSSFETCILHSSIAFSSANAVMAALQHPPLFVVGDGSALDRLRMINNRIKHFDEDISKGRHCNVVPAWLTDDGIESSQASITYEELSTVLTDASDDSKHLSETWFNEIAERRKAELAPGTQTIAAGNGDEA